MPLGLVLKPWYREIIELCTKILLALSMHMGHTAEHPFQSFDDKIQNKREAMEKRGYIMVQELDFTVGS